MQLPLPSHLKDILKPIGNENTEFLLTGKVVCSCNSENFTIKIVGDDSEYEEENVIRVIEVDGNYFLIIKVECNSCHKEHLIFDDGFHGWNGFVCGIINKSLPRPEAKAWGCNKCTKTNHSIVVTISSQGKDDFISEGGTDEGFDENDWVEAFDWITIGIACNSCEEKNDEWISYETM